VSHILPDTFRPLVKASTETDQFASVSQTLEVNQGNAGGLEIACARNSSVSREIESAFPISEMRFGHGVIYCRQVIEIVNIRKQLANQACRLLGCRVGSWLDEERCLCDPHTDKDLDTVADSYEDQAHRHGKDVWRLDLE
jgi:hypothetical protein